MSVSIFIRRLHLYLGIGLVPWFFMYAIGAFVLNHGQLFASLHKSDKPEWTVRLEREYQRPVPKDADLRTVGEVILQDFGLGGRSFWANKPNDKQLTVHAYKFLSTTEVVYFLDKGRAEVRDFPFHWDHFFAGMHERGGFTQKPWMTKMWACIVDLVGIAVVTWVISGIYVWWTSRQRRLAGGVVLAAGVICFVGLIMVL